MLYIALLLVSGFTGAMAWISLCWAQINFRKRLYQAGYTITDLQYITPGSPYTGYSAIILMLICLIFLVINNDITYKVAFIIGIISFITQIIIYALMRRRSRHPHLASNMCLQFKDIFPEKFQYDNSQPPS